MTVVIPAYGRCEMVARALRSVAAQTCLPEEVIVVDDASGDDTAARARDLGARVISHEVNLGRGASRNTGMNAAVHDWVALLDSDDEWLPQHLQMLWGGRYGHVLVGGAALGVGDDARQRIYGWAGRRPLVLRGPSDVVAPENRIASSAVMISRPVALAAGGFGALPRAEDLDLWVRMLERGSGLSLPDVTALYHHHPGQVSADAALMHDAHRTVLRLHEHRPWWSRRLQHRHEGMVAWDTARARLRAGQGLTSAVKAMGPATKPQGAVGVAQLLRGRLRARKAGGRLTQRGAPRLAVMPGVPPGGAIPPGAEDLRGLRTLPALLEVARRPPAEMLVRGKAARCCAKVLGARPMAPPGET